MGKSGKRKSEGGGPSGSGTAKAAKSGKADPAPKGQLAAVPKEAKGYPHLKLFDEWLWLGLAPYSSALVIL